MRLIDYLLSSRSIKISGADTKINNHSVGVSANRICEKELILSLTSYPARINNVDKTIKTLINQTIKPNRLILWLAKEQFPNGEKSLPRKLLNLKRNGLEIEWVDKDIRSYKKLIPALLYFPESVIITVDDDWYYHRDLVKTLVEEHIQNPEMIISNLITHPYLDSKGEFHSGDNPEQFIGIASLWNKVLGCGGVLYPPKALNQEVFHDFMDIAPTNDDIWFWAMAVLNKTKTKVPDNPAKLVALTSMKTQMDTSLSCFNSTNNTYIRDTEAIFQRFPEIKKILLSTK